MASPSAYGVYGAGKERSMYRGQMRSGGLLGGDRAVADQVREINELRRSRSLPEYEPTRAVVTARQRSRWCRAVRARRLHG